MAKGVPIRLVQENGNLIELDATNMVLSTTRKVGGAALPWTGSRRIGMDWNINKAMINIQGIIADDRIGISAAANSATIDFGHYFRDIDSNAGIWASANNLANLLGRKLRLQPYGATTKSAWYTISFTNTGSAGGTAYSSNGGAGSTPTILVNTSDGTPEQIATAVAAYINAQLSSKLTATVPTNGGKKTSDTGALIDASTLVNISMTTLGSGQTMGLGSPDFEKVNDDGAYFENPIISKFAGGVDSYQKSAGDKVQDLYGIINNSSRMGNTQTVGVNMRGRPRTRTVNSEYRDYIVGIQIPYNSTIKAEGGEEYVARNFFMPTGLDHKGKEKTSEGNDHPASVEMDLADETQGIQGSVQKLDITYDAGESVYSFNLIFAPIDNMILS
tara:strand:+ start:1915 stop:3078 length:1164 start_codon:yes stop_codon:yes gene_type:complete